MCLYTQMKRMLTYMSGMEKNWLLIKLSLQGVIPNTPNGYVSILKLPIGAGLISTTFHPHYRRPPLR